MTHKPYVVQLGRTRHPLYTERYATEKLARAFMLRQIDRVEQVHRGLVPPELRYAQPVFAALDEARQDLDAALFEPEPQTIDRLIDDYSGMRITMVFWVES